MKGINIFLADGFEDMEALATNDVLRRGGADTVLVSINGSLAVTSSHNVSVKADAMLKDILKNDNSEITEKDIMIFPGGMPGTRNLAACTSLVSAMRRHYAAGGTLAAICAAPGLVLGQLEDSLKRVEFTCFDGFEATPVKYGAIFTPRPAVTCGRLITGRSAGHAVSFGLAILEKVKGHEAAADTGHSVYLETI